MGANRPFQQIRYPSQRHSIFPIFRIHAILFLLYFNSPPDRRARRRSRPRDPRAPPLRLLHRPPPRGQRSRIPAHPHSGDGAGGLVLCGDRARAHAPDRRPGLRGGRERDQARPRAGPITRLEPALRLAARSVADGDLAAIDRLLRAPGRLEKYAAIDGADPAAKEGGRKWRLAKLNGMVENLERRRELHGEAAPGETDSTEAEAALDATDSPDFVDDPAAPSSARLDIA
jgi:hypothetical protein